MDPDKDNANPLILNASDLPTRNRSHIVKPRSDGSTGLFDSLVPSHAYYTSSSEASDSSEDEDEAVEEIDEQEIYGQLRTSSSPSQSLCPPTQPRSPTNSHHPIDLIATIADPEHPLSLGSLAVVNLRDIHITPPASPASPISSVLVEITPTITHCSLATVIGLGVRVRLEQALPPRFRIDVRVKEGTHSTGDAVSKQLGDKERVAAALENATLMGVLRKMLSTCE